MARSTEDYETSDSEVDRGEAAFMGNLKVRRCRAELHRVPFPHFPFERRLTA